EGTGEVGATGILYRLDPNPDQSEWPSCFVNQLSGNEVATVRDHGETAVGAGEAKTGQAAEGVDRALQFQATAPDQALHRIADRRLGKLADRHRGDCLLFLRQRQW